MKQTFEAIITKVESKRMASIDMEIRVNLVTEDVRVLDLGKIAPDQTVVVTISTEKGHGNTKAAGGFSYV